MAEARYRRENQYPLPSYKPWQKRQTFISFLEDAEHCRRERVTKEHHRHRGMVSYPRRSNDGAGLSNAPPLPSGADATGEDSEDNVLF
jgi:hypothetical protein